MNKIYEKNKLRINFYFVILEHLCTSPGILRIIKLRRMRLTAHVAKMVEKRNKKN
jgi:hypothetical protein